MSQPARKPEATKKSPAHPSSGKAYWQWAALVVILSATFFSYQPAINAKLTNWDDDKYVTENPAIRDLSVKNLKTLLTKNFEGNYHPVTMLSFAINYSQGQLDPGVYHRTNVYLHLLNTAFVFWLVLLLLANLRMAAIASALFGIHTLHVESVAWVSERKDVLYAFFFLLSLISYIYYLKKESRLLYIFSLVLFSFSLLSKGMAVSLAVSLFIVDFYFGRKITHWKSILDKIPFLLLALVLGFVAVKAQHIQSLDLANETSFPFFQRIVFAGYAFISYIGKLIYPYHLAIFYPYPIKLGESMPLMYYFYLVLALGLTAFIIYSLKFSKKYFFGYAFFLLNIVLVLQLISVGKAVMADRYTYVSSIGFFFIAASTYELIRPKFRMAFVGLFLIYSLILIVQTRARCLVWHDSLSLWNDQIAKYPEHTEAYKNRGLVKGQAGDYQGAIADFDKVIEQDPNFSSAYTDRGMARQLQHDTIGALTDYSLAISKDNKQVLAYYNRGNLKLEMKYFNESLSDLNAALSLSPDDANILYDRGRANMNLNEMKAAIDDFTMAISLNPEFALAYTNRGLIKMNLKDYVSAMSDYNSAIRYNPRLAVAYYNRGVLKYNSNNLAEACKDFKVALELGHADASGLISLFCK